MGFGPAPPPPMPRPPHKRCFKVGDFYLSALKRYAAINFDPVDRKFFATWTGWGGTPRRETISNEKISEYLTDEEIARCLAAAIAASATP